MAEKSVTNKVPPEGGWGWMVVIAFALCNIVLVSFFTNFGLIYNDKINDMKLSGSDVTLIININAAFGMSSGLLTGPLIKSFGYRKIAIAGGICLTLGTICSSIVNQFTTFLFWYGFIAPIGYSFGTAAFTLALNTYFKVHRNKAAGIAMSLTGFGPILYPMLVTLLLNFYDVNGCVLILGGVSAHMIVAALLLQPIKWHLKENRIDSNALEMIVQNGPGSSPKDTSILYDENHQRRSSAPSTGNTVHQQRQLTENSCSESQYMLRSKEYSDQPSTATGEMIAANNNVATEKSEPRKTVWQRTVHMFDLNLLRDPVYVNIMIGMSVAMFAEINFTILTPFILIDKQFETLEVASILSFLGAFDIVSRLVSPFVGDYFKQSARIMYMIGLVLLIITRTGIVIGSTYTEMIIVAFALGIAKGIRNVYITVVIASHVSIDRLPSAAGLQMVTTGLILIIVGPIVGLIRDLTGSYTYCVLLLNCATFFTIVMWILEMLYCRCVK